MKVKAPNHLQNSEVILPQVGKVAIPLDCILELEDAIAIMMVERGGWAMVEVKVEGGDSIDNLSLKDLIKIVEDAGISEMDYKPLKKNREAMAQFVKDFLLNKEK